MIHSALDSWKTEESKGMFPLRNRAPDGVHTLRPVSGQDAIGWRIKNNY